MCSNAETEGDQLLKQFVQSLKGIAFDWYANLEAELVNNWEQMEHVLLNRLYSTWCTVNMMEPTNSKQWKNELVVDYISCWRSLILQCKEYLSKASCSEMCA